MFFSMPILVLFWQENGLNFKEIMILQSLYFVMVVVLEIPSGYFSDKVGRKKTIVISSFFWFLGILVYSFGFSFQSFL
jgi:MFS family permease